MEGGGVIAYSSSSSLSAMTVEGNFYEDDDFIQTFYNSSNHKDIVAEETRDLPAMRLDHNISFWISEEEVISDEDEADFEEMQQHWPTEDNVVLFQGNIRRSPLISEEVFETVKKRCIIDKEFVAAASHESTGLRHDHNSSWLTDEDDDEELQLTLEDVSQETIKKHSIISLPDKEPNFNYIKEKGAVSEVECEKLQLTREAPLLLSEGPVISLPDKEYVAAEKETFELPVVRRSRFYINHALAMDEEEEEEDISDEDEVLFQVKQWTGDDILEYMSRRGSRSLYLDNFIEVQG